MVARLFFSSTPVPSRVSERSAVRELRRALWFMGFSSLVASLVSRVLAPARLARGRRFVLKQGLGGQLPGSTRLSAAGSHCSAEFFALRLYKLCGAPVPSSCLFRVQLADDDPEFDLCSFVLLTEWIDGKKVDAAQSEDACRDAWADLAIGVRHGNLIQKANGAVYRVDAKSRPNG